MGFIGDYLKSVKADRTEWWTHEQRDKRIRYRSTEAGFYALRADANALCRACRSSDGASAHQVLADLKELVVELVEEVGSEPQTYEQLRAIVEAAYALVDQAQSMQTFRNPISAFANSYGYRFPDTTVPGDPYLNRERAFLAACDTLIAQGDKYLNPDPTPSNAQEFNRWGHRSNDPYEDDNHESNNGYYQDEYGRWWPLP